MFNPVMAGGDDDYCQCNLEKNEGNTGNHIYVCPDSDLYNKKSCSGDEVQLLGFLNELAHGLNYINMHIPNNYNIAEPNRDSIIALNAEIKAKIMEGLSMSICGNNTFISEVSSMRQIGMDNISELNIEFCPFTTQELSEITHFIRFVVSPFDTDNESIRCDQENNALIASCRYALTRWCSVYGERAPRARWERVILHSLVVAFCLVSYVESREHYLLYDLKNTALTPELSNQYNYFVSISEVIRCMCSDSVLGDKYQDQACFNMMLKHINMDDYYESKLDVLSESVCTNITGFSLQAVSNIRGICLDFILIKNIEDITIRTLITPELYWLTSSNSSFETDIKALLSKIPERQSLPVSRIKHTFKTGVGMTGYIFNSFRTLILRK